MFALRAKKIFAELYPLNIFSVLTSKQESDLATPLKWGG